MENKTKELDIAFLFAWMPEEKWSTPLSIVNECRRRNIKCRIYSLYDKNKNYTNAGLKALYEHTKKSYKPDIIFNMDYGVFDDPLLSKEAFPESYMVLEAGDDPQRFGHNIRKAYKFDLILTPDLVSVNDYNKMGINAHYWTHFADFIEGKENLNISPNYDLVSTRGDGDTPFLDQIKNVIGNRFLNKRDYNILQRDTLSQGKIVIQNSRYKEVSRRIFEGMYCNRMVMADRLPEERGLELLFEDKKDIVYYDNLKDAIEKINYYSNNEEERLKIAKNGYNRVLNNHTTIQRLDFILNHYKKTL
jgi:spore maturation protein CgeB